MQHISDDKSQLSSFHRCHPALSLVIHSGHYKVPQVGVLPRASSLLVCQLDQVELLLSKASSKAWIVCSVQCWGSIAAWDRRHCTSINCLLGREYIY